MFALDQEIYMAAPRLEDALVLRGGSWGIDSQLIISETSPVIVAVISNTTVGSAQFPAWKISEVIFAKALTAYEHR